MTGLQDFSLRPLGSKKDLFGSWMRFGFPPKMPVTMRGHPFTNHLLNFLNILVNQPGFVFVGDCVGSSPHLISQWSQTIYHPWNGYRIHILYRLALLNRSFSLYQGGIRDRFLEGIHFYQGANTNLHALHWQTGCPT